jgi:hypothetical protein
MSGKKMSIRGFRREEKGMICIQSNGRLHEKPSQRKAEQQKNAGTYLVPGSHKRLTSRKRIMCSRNMGAHVQRGIQSTKGMQTG